MPQAHLHKRAPMPPPTTIGLCVFIIQEIFRSIFDVPLGEKLVPTLFHHVVTGTRRILPTAVARRLRGVATALVTPLLWTVKTSHWKSCLTSASTDSTGPVPWYTYPAINLLQATNFRDRNVLEFGAGNSTLWWASQAEHVRSLESSPEWFAKLGKTVPSNVSLFLVPDYVDEQSMAICQEGAPYDVIVIDGLDRLGFSLVAQNWINDQGIIIFDNSEGTWGGSRNKPYPIIDHFHSLGFQRVDFYGYAPNMSTSHCTSIFFKASCFLFNPTQPPQ